MKPSKQRKMLRAIEYNKARRKADAFKVCEQQMTAYANFKFRGFYFGGKSCY